MANLLFRLSFWLLGRFRNSSATILKPLTSKTRFSGPSENWIVGGVATRRFIKRLEIQYMGG